MSLAINETNLSTTACFTPFSLSVSS